MPKVSLSTLIIAVGLIVASVLLTILDFRPPPQRPSEITINGSLIRLSEGYSFVFVDVTNGKVAIQDTRGRVTNYKLGPGNSLTPENPPQ